MSGRGRRLAAVALALAAVSGVVQIAAHGRLFAARVAFPLDLEWMEGGMLVHAQRLAHGQSIYPAPSVDFVPYLYTPLYPAVLALLSKLVGLGYVLGRAVSLASFAGALGVLVALALRAAGGVAGGVRAAVIALALGAAGAVVASFELTGGFYDIVRGDSLLLLLEAGALACAATGRGARSAVAAAVLIVAAFFTKQTAAVVGVGIGVGLLVADGRRGVIYGLVAAALLGAFTLALVKATDGWFWIYVFKTHQGHDYRWHAGFVGTPLRLLREEWGLYLACVLPAGALAATGRLERRDAVVACAAVAGFLAGCLGFATQWAFENAYIPSIFFPAVAAAVFGARLVRAALAEGAAPRDLALAGVAALALAAQPVLHVVERGGSLRPALRVLPDPTLAPSDADRAAAARLLETLRALPGDVFIPFHPWYAVLAGKPAFVHRMGVMDVSRAGLGRPRGLDDGFARRRWPHVVLDWKSQPGEWPLLDLHYHRVRDLREGVDSVRSFSGAETSPRVVYAANREAPRRPGETVLADFETPRWAGWSAGGAAFGLGPGPAPAGMFGGRAADSGVNGEAATGSLRTGVLRLVKPHLAFTLSGAPDPGLRVALLDGDRVLRSAAPAGAPREVVWDVADLAGRSVVFLVEDASTKGHLAVDQIVAY